MLNVKRIIAFFYTLFLILLVAGITFFMTKTFYLKNEKTEVVVHNKINKPVMKNISIISTLGKEGWKDIKDFYDAGTTIFRINGSHIKSKEDMQKMLDGAKDNLAYCENGSLMYDTQGPEIRTRIIDGGKANAAYQIKIGDKVIVHTNLDDKEIVFKKDPARVKFVGKTIHIGVNYDKFIDDVKVDRYLTIEARLIDAKVVAIDKDKGTVELLITKVNTDNGEYKLTDRRHINLYGAPVSQPTLTEADKEYIKMFVREGGKYIAASFVRSEDDIHDLHALIKQAFIEGGATEEEANNKVLEVSIIAKFETRQGLENIYSIMNLADGAMIARGDLSSEIPAEDVPYVKELISDVCTQDGNKLCILATDVLESLTRQEVVSKNDIDTIVSSLKVGVNGLMLSNETTQTKNPVKIIKELKKHADIYQRRSIFDYYEKVFDEVQKYLSYQQEQTGIEKDFYGFNITKGMDEQVSDMMRSAFGDDGNAYKIDKIKHVLYLNPYKVVEHVDEDIALGHEHKLEQHDAAYMNAIFSRMGANEYKLHHLIFDSVEPTVHIAYFDKYKGLFPKPEPVEKKVEKEEEPAEEKVDEKVEEKVNKNVPTEEEAAAEGEKEVKEDGEIE